MDKKLFILLLSVFIDLLGFGIVIPILPLLVEESGGGAFLIGAIISVYSLFQFLFSPILGRLSDKHGRRPVLLVSVLINASSYFLVFFTQSLWILFLARIIAGIGSANLSVAQAAVADTSKAHERTKRMALLGAVFGLGFIFGPLLGGITSANFTLHTPFLIPGILSLLNAVLIIFFLPETNKTLQKDIKIEFFNMKVTKEILTPKNMAYLMLLFFLVNFALSLIIGMLPLFSKETYGWNEEQNGYYFGLIGLASFISQAFLIRLLLKRFNEVHLIKGGLVVFGLSCIFIGIAPGVFIFLAAGALSAVGFSILNTNAQALISLESNENEQGIVLGVAQSIASLARVAGPLVGGILATYKLGLPYIASGIFALLILLYGQKYLKNIHFSKK